MTAVLSAFIVSFLVFYDVVSLLRLAMSLVGSFSLLGTGTGNQGKVPRLMVTIGCFYDDSTKESTSKGVVFYTMVEPF